VVVTSGFAWGIFFFGFSRLFDGGLNAFKGALYACGGLCLLILSGALWW